MKGFIANHLNRFLPKGSALRHVSLVAGGTTIAQGINIAIMPLLSRIYSPEDFGVMAVYASVTSILVEVSGFRYHFAIPLPKDERYAKALVILSFFLQAVFVAFISIILLFFGKPILAKLFMEVLIPYRLLIPIGVAGMGVYLTLTQWAIREKMFHTIGKTRITQALSGAATMAVLGLAGLKPVGLLLGTIMSRAGGITTLLTGLLKKNDLPRPVKSDIKRVALRYRKFPMYSTWTGMLNTVGRQIMPILLVSFYSPHVAGLFAMAQRLLHLPSVFIGQAIGQVFLQRASVAHHQGNLKELSMRTYTTLLRLGLFPILLLSFFAPPVFAYVLGERWLDAGSFARVLGPWIALVFAYGPISSLYAVLDRQGMGLLFEIIYITTRVAAFLLGALLGGPLIATSFFGLTGFLIVFLKMNYILSVAGNNLRNILRKNLKMFLETLLMVVFPIIALLLSFPFYVLVFSLILSTAAYFIRVISLVKSKNTGGRK